jgi:hypothetical protein
MRSDSNVSPAVVGRFFPSLGKFLTALLGLVVLVASVTALIAAKGPRRFAKGHPYLIYASLIISLAIIIVLCYGIYYLYPKYKALRRSEKSLQVPPPTDGDRAMSKRIVSIIPPDGDIMRWLKLDFDAASLPADLVRRLRQVNETLVLSPVDFTDEAAQGRYEAYMLALSQFTGTLAQWTKTDARGEPRLPNQWDCRSRYEAATAAIAEAHTQLVTSYDHLMNACHRFQVDA